MHEKPSLEGVKESLEMTPFNAKQFLLQVEPTGHLQEVYLSRLYLIFQALFSALGHSLPFSITARLRTSKLFLSIKTLQVLLSVST